MAAMLSYQHNADYIQEKKDRDQYIKTNAANKGKLKKPLATRTSTLKAAKMTNIAREYKGLPPLDPSLLPPKPTFGKGGDSSSRLPSLTGKYAPRAVSRTGSQGRSRFEKLSYSSGQQKKAYDNII